MYGLIHNALRQMITENHGEETWQKIVETSQVPDDSFLAMRSYDDATTFALAGATAEVLGAPLEDCLELFGEYWMAQFAPQSYESLLDAAGHNLFDFLENLDALHDRISTTFVGYVPPSFNLQRESEQVAIVNYVSGRNGMLPFVLGLIKGMQQRFNVTIHIEQIDFTKTEAGDRATLRLTMESTDG